MRCRTAAPKNAKNEENKMLKQLLHSLLLKPQQRTQRFQHCTKLPRTMCACTYGIDHSFNGYHDKLVVTPKSRQYMHPTSTRGRVEKKKKQGESVCRNQTGGVLILEVMIYNYCSFSLLLTIAVYA